MITRDPEVLADLVVEAARMAGQRLILSPGQVGPGVAPHGPAG